MFPLTHFYSRGIVPVRKREATWDLAGAAVHRHILDRVNAINDSLKTKNTVVIVSAYLGIVIKEVISEFSTESCVFLSTGVLFST